MTPERLKEWAEGIQREHRAHMAGFSVSTPGGYCAADGFAHPCEAYRLAGMVLGVLEIHKAPARSWEWSCRGCAVQYPCRTIQALCERAGEEGEG